MLALYRLQSSAGGYTATDTSVVQLPSAPKLARCATSSHCGLDLVPYWTDVDLGVSHSCLVFQQARGRNAPDARRHPGGANITPFSLLVQTPSGQFAVVGVAWISPRTAGPD